VKTTLPDPALDESLRQRERQEHIDLVVPPHEIEWDFEHRPALADTSIVPEHIDIPRLRVRNIVRIKQIELFDPQV
jgi:hypothetical protein